MPLEGCSCNSLALHCVKCNSRGPYSPNSVKRFLRKQRVKISTSRCTLIKLYNKAMCAANIAGAAVAAYKFKGKKWWWPHFTNNFGVFMGTAWEIQRPTNPDEKAALLHFVRSMVQSYLHLDRIITGPTGDFWKTKKFVDDSIHFIGLSNWLAQIEKQRGYQYLCCSSKVWTTYEKSDLALYI